MKGKKILLSVILIMVAIVLMFSTNTFAATGTWKLGVVKVREGVSFRVNADNTYETFIKSSQYSYQMYLSGETRIPVLKIVDKTTGTPDYSNAIYCLKAGQGFGSTNGNGGMEDVTYDTYYDMVADRTRIKNILGITSDRDYNSILWLLDNIYLPKQYKTDEDKGLARYTLLGNALQDLILDPNSNLYHKGMSDIQITDDDIEVVQQWALWHFTNKGESNFSSNSLPQIYVSTNGELTTYDALSGKGPDLKTTAGWAQSTLEGAVRAEEATALYKYLIEEAEKNSNYSRETTIIRFNDTLEAKVQQQSILPTVKQIIAGPFELTKTGNTEVTFLDELNQVTDEEGNSLSYTITDEDGNILSGLSSGARLKDVVGKGRFYIKINNVNASNTNIKKINLKIKYTTTSDTTATLWTNSKNNDDQPVVVVEKKPTTLEDSTSVEVKEFDLALRKYIKEVRRNNVKVTIEELDGRFPEVDKTNLKTRTNGKTGKTATYKHRKDPVPVQTGDIVKYAIEIFNEGEVAGIAREIIDYLPAGLEFVEPAEGFSADNYRFTTSGNQLIITAKNKGTMLDPFDGLDLDWVTIEFYCRVTAKENKSSDKDTILTNIAEITKAYDENDILMSEEGDDRDSKPSNLSRPNESDLPDYKGNTKNKDNLADKNYFYKGQEDDDDFEKLKVTTPEFDLSLRKFITKVGDTVITDRAPNVDKTPLQNGEETAIYKHQKEAIEVNAGSLVEYTIRVYNEGDIAGYPTIIEDYLPEELEFVANHPTNIEYKWNAAGRILTTQYIDKAIPAYNKETDTLSYRDVKVVCRVKSDAPDEKILTNIAQIIGYSRDDDRDSEPDGFRVSDANLPSYRGKSTGADQNKTDLTDKNYYYKGQEDDDDFEKVKVKVYKSGFDLALRKFITKIGDTNITDRVPDVDTTPLKNKTDETAIYTHPKNPLTVKVGDLVEYTIRVYNEGEENGYATMIEDYLPEELEFVANHPTNIEYKWTAAGRIITTDYLKNTELQAYNGGDTLSFADVKIVCRLKGISSEEDLGKVLTNIAQINNDSGDDRDSQPGNVRKPSDKDLPNYDEHQQDDDDFEKIKVYQPEYDLALRKFITKIGDTVITDRIPKVDTTPLTDGSGKTTAIYTHPKTPLLVKNGDTVEYTIRIYNEGKVDAYAELVKDNIPEGLGFIIDNETNIDYLWKVSDDGKQISTNYLSKEMDEDNIIKAFDPTTMDTLDYKDVKVVFTVVEPNTSTRIITNIAEIKDDDGKDIDSTPDNDDPDEDDIDVEHIRLKTFDLALRKFITKVESKTGENLPIETDKTTDVSREPKVEIDEETGKIKYVHPKDPVVVANSDIVIYTLRVYNEGTIAGFANEIKDDVPVGLELVPSHEVNNKYGWVMYDEEGNETDDVKKAKTIRTTYLSEENDENNIIPAFDRVTMETPAYKDVQVAFKVIEKNVGEERVVINTAEISKDSDDDNDSTPDNDDPDEDDIDQEFIKLKYFDLSLLKWVSKVMVTENGTTKVTETGYNGLENPEPIVKLELKPSQINSIVIKYEYGIKITNEGEIAGYAKEVADYIPEGLEFIPEDNPLWTEKEDGKIVTTQLENTLLQPGESAIINVVFKWKNGKDNMGIKENWAEISKDENDKDAEDIDSIPDNKKPGEDDIDNALVILSPKTGKVVMFVVLPTIVTLILAGGIILIKKYVM